MQKDTSIKDIYDITIIGGGPVGLFTAYYAGLRGAKTKLIESLEELGGQTLHLYSSKQIKDIPAIPVISGTHLSQQLIQQAMTYQPTICCHETIELLIEANEEHPYIQLVSQKQAHYTKTVILATGNGAFNPRPLPFDYDQGIEGQSLHYFADDLAIFKDKRVAITGGGDSALDWALTLEPIAEEVNLIHRRKRFRGHEASVQALNKSNVHQFTPYIPVEIKNQGSQIKELVINEGRTDNYIHLAIDHLIVAFGFTSSIEALKAWGLDFERNAIAVSYRMETSLAGVFAVGDCVYYPGKTKLIATGFGEAPMAVNSALIYIDPEANTAPLHSNH